MDIIRPLRISMILENVAQVRHVAQSVAARGLPRTAFYQGQAAIPAAIPADVVHTAAANSPVGDHTWA